MKFSALVRILLPVVLVLYFFSSCTKEDYTLTHGDVSGIAKPEGVKIIFDRGDKKFSTVSDSIGWYTMQNLETGIYTVIFEKKGYLSFKKFGFQFLGGSSTVILNGSTLHPQITAKLTIQNASATSYHSISITGIYDKNKDTDYSEIGGIMWIMSDKSGVTLTNCLQHEVSSYSVSDNNFSSQVQVDEKLLGGSSSIFIRGYIRATWDSYYDWEQNVWEYGIGENVSNEMKVEIPAGFFNN